MNPSSQLLAPGRPGFRLLSACAGFALLIGPLHAAAPVATNLSGGLDQLVKSRYELKNARAAGASLDSVRSADGQKYTSRQAAAFADRAIKDEEGRLLVRVHFDGLTSFKAAKKAIKAAAPSLVITAIDKSYRAGVLNAYVDIDEVTRLAQAKGVGSVALESLPDVERTSPQTQAAKGDRVDPQATPGQTYPNLGTTFDAGVIQHRVDRINRYYNASAGLDLQGQGMQIGFISDSYARTTTISAATDVANFDLPGSSSNPVNTTPVYLFLENPAAGGTDEGRAMVQIGYRMAPKAALAFGSANGGVVGFANVIRGLAGIAGFTNSGQTFAADVICDDVTYSDEPVYEDGIIAQGVEDASAAGVAYFASAGNNIGTNTYEGTFQYVPFTGGTTAANNPALVGTNINLANVPANLYQGGFHNFSPTGRDVAQTWGSTASISSSSRTTMQWDDPYNQDVTFNTPAIYTAGGTSNGATVTPASFTTPSLTAGSNYVLIVSANAGSGFDAIVTVKDPNGATVVDAQDTGTDETINFFPTVTGPYTLVVTPYASTTGAFTVNVYTGNNPRVSTDFNLLVFDANGNYLPGSSETADNIANNTPFETGYSYAAAGQTRVQFLVTRSAVPTAPTPASHFRIDFRGNGAQGYGPVEYFTINQPNTKAHSTAPSCNSTAAYSVFRPSLPEYFTSPGPVVKYFDKFGNRLATPELRLKPVIAAADQGNTSFFASDSTSDVDAKPNFGGTSAAAPHAAAIGALVLQGHGGRRSVTPAQLTSILQRSTFPHDLDPNYVTGVARVAGASSGKVTITVNSDFVLNPGAAAFNPNSISVTYIGSGSLSTLTFNPEGTALTGGGTADGNNGLDATNVYYDNVYPGMIFAPNTVPFTIGGGTAALTNTTAAFTNQAPAPSVAGQWWTLGLTFPSGAFTGGATFNFTVGRGVQHSAVVTGGLAANNGTTSTNFTQADLLGGTVLLPQGTGSGSGMTFQGTMTDGTVFNGVFKNRIGSGYSVVDGFGFIDAATAVSQTIQ